MFIKETTETNTYTRKSKFGKFNSYKRIKTLTHWRCDQCQAEFNKVKNGPYNNQSKSYCKTCVSKIGLAKLAGAAGYQAKIKNKFTNRVGTVISGKEGYPEVYIGKDYPYRPGGYRCIREHVFVMEMYLQRRIEKGEIIHHIDGNKRNNKLENLFLTTVTEHNKLHAESESIIFELVKKGMVIFNRETARYELANV
jgi:hypothetical protein